jgi:hypothetical protein
VFEITLRHKGDYHDPFFDVIIDLMCTSATGKVIQVGGFYYGSSSGVDGHAINSQTDSPKTQQESRHSDKLDLSARVAADLWKVQFAPCELGKWKYNIVFKNVKGEMASGQGTFICVKGRKPNPGFVRCNPANPFRFVFDDGSPYFPIGLQECWGDGSGNGSVLDECSMEGPFRTDLKDPPPLPSGPMFVRGPSSNPQNDEENMLKVKRFIKYSVDRWGAYVDFWEFLNE